MDPMKQRSHFWPLADDFEVEIFDCLSWDLPGYRKQGRDFGRYKAKIKKRIKTEQNSKI